MLYIVLFVVGAVAGFITGVLVGKRNSQTVSRVVNTTNKVVDDIKNA